MSVIETVKLIEGLKKKLEDINKQVDLVEKQRIEFHSYLEALIKHLSKEK